jgi:hypothetical protein
MALLTQYITVREVNVVYCVVFDTGRAGCAHSKSTKKKKKEAKSGITGLIY